MDAHRLIGDAQAFATMQAALTGGSAMHLRAAENGFRFLEQQSFASRGWGRASCYAARAATSWPRH